MMRPPKECVLHMYMCKSLQTLRTRLFGNILRHRWGITDITPENHSMCQGATHRHLLVERLVKIGEATVAELEVLES